MLVLALVAAAGPPTATASAQVDPLAGARAVATARATAVREQDRAAFLATVDPQAPADFRAVQARAFDGVTSLPLDDYRIEVEAEHSGDLSPPDLRRSYGGARTFIPETKVRYRLRGYDDRDATSAQWLTYVERGDTWYVGADDDLAPLGLETDLNLWDLGPVRLRPTRHFLIVSHPDTAARADQLAGLAEQAMTRFIQLWPEPWSRRLPIILPSSVDELGLLLHATFDLDNFVAFVTRPIDRDDGYEVSAPRMYIQDRNLTTYGQGYQVETLVHELVHAATAPATSPFADIWVQEGVADWVAKGRRVDEAPPGGTDGRLPDPWEFRTGGGHNINLAYGESRSAVAHLARTRGQAAPAALVRELGAVRSAPGSVDYRVDQALRQVAGVGFTDFQRRWSGR